MKSLYVFIVSVTSSIDKNKIKMPSSSTSFVEKLRYFPNTAIGVVLGIAGNAVLWRALSRAPFTRDFFTLNSDGSNI